MREFVEAVYVMVYRELKRFSRSRSRLVGSVVNPLVWLVFFGLGWAGAFRAPAMRALLGGIDYVSYLAPGVAAMAMFTGSLVSGIALIFDKQFGFFKEVLVAPAPRAAALLGRVLGSALTATLQGALILAFSLLLAPSLSPVGIPVALAYGLVASVGFSSLGVLLATRISSHEGFQLVTSFLMMPLIFLSGAFYPVDRMPEWMRVLAYANPLTYAVDGMRYWLAGVSSFDPLLDFVVLAALSAALTAAAVLAFERATLE